MIRIHTVLKLFKTIMVTTFNGMNSFCCTLPACSLHACLHICSLVPVGSSASILRVDLYDTSLPDKLKLLGSVKANLLALSDSNPHEHWFKIRPSQHSPLVGGELRLVLQYVATKVGS